MHHHVNPLRPFRSVRKSLIVGWLPVVCRACCGIVRSQTQQNRPAVRLTSMVATDERADFAAFVRSYGNTMKRLGHAVSGDPDIAEDATQSALIKVFKHWHEIEHPRAYARRAVVSECIDRGRRLQREKVTPAGEWGTLPGERGTSPKIKRHGRCARRSGKQFVGCPSAAGGARAALLRIPHRLRDRRRSRHQRRRCAVHSLESSRGTAIDLHRGREMIDNHSTRPKLESQLRVMYDRVAAATPPLGDLRQVRRDHSRPRRHLVGPLCAVATVVAVAGLSATAIHAWGQQSDDDSVRPGPAVGPRVGLIVRVADSLVPQARIRGVLDLNADGCVTLDGLLLIAPAGPRSWTTPVVSPFPVSDPSGSAPPSKVREGSHRAQRMRT